MLNESIYLLKLKKEIYFNRENKIELFFSLKRVELITFFKYKLSQSNVELI